ncbi:MAG: Spi family protease inhibitor [Bacteroidales bacterium]|nr:Spi family protease inhibitor [Bacteroidales bacterium]
MKKTLKNHGIYALLLTFVFLSQMFSSKFITAAPVDLGKAKQVAINWYLERSNKTDLGKIEIIETFVEKEKSIIVFYIFNFKQGGFMIVSADDNVFPVLGYGYLEHYKTENHPPAFDWLLNKYK